MLTTSTLMDAAKAAQSIPSDYRLARVLDASENTLYYWRRGRACDDENAAKLAAMAGVPVGFALVCIAAERTKDPAAKSGYLAAATALEKLLDMDILSMLAKGASSPKSDRVTGLNGPEMASADAGTHAIHQSKCVTRATTSHDAFTRGTSEQVCAARNAPEFSALASAFIAPGLWITGRRNRLMRGPAETVRR